MDFMLRFDVWFNDIRGSRKAGGSWQQLWQIFIDIAIIKGRYSFEGKHVGRLQQIRPRKPR